MTSFRLEPNFDKRARIGRTDNESIDCVEFRSFSMLTSAAMTPEMQLMINDALHEFLLWVGFGTMVGLTAKAIMPGRDPGGTITTFLVGIGGTVIGCAIAYYFTDGQQVSPLTRLGFLAATGGSFILLLFFRIMAGSFYIEAEDGDRIIYRRRRGRWGRRRYASE